MSERSREIMTYTGKMFDFWKPKPEMICIEDIAHALALTNRYGGHTRVSYSVAEHCVRMSHLDTGDPLINLLHDAAEAYIGDIPSPQKKGLQWFTNDMGRVWTYKVVENNILRVIGDALGVSDLHLQVEEKTKEGDLIMLATEVRDLMPPQAQDAFQGWLQDTKPLTHRIFPGNWEYAELDYLRRFKELMNGKS